MLVINKNANNYLTVTLSEKTTLTSPTYLFSFTNCTDDVNVTFIAADESLFTDRYNKFLITETSGTINLTSGVISLESEGFWEYTIYEQESTTNLDTTLTTGIVEKGRVKVVGTQTESPSYDSPKTYTQYDGS